MPRSKRNISEKEKEIEFQQKLKYKLDSLKTDFEAGKIVSFRQIEALIPYSVMARQIHMGYAAFKKKCNSPGDFSNNELVRIAELINVDVDLIVKFIFSLIQMQVKKNEKKKV